MLVEGLGPWRDNLREAPYEGAPMTGFFIAIGLFLAVVLVIGIRHDRRQRGLGSMSGTGTSDRTRLDNQTRADKWGGPGH
jgi:hypothetical protein